MVIIGHPSKDFLSDNFATGHAIYILKKLLIKFILKF